MLKTSGWVWAVLGVGCSVAWAAPARADEPKVTSGIAAGNTDSAGGEKAEVSVRSTGEPVTVAVIEDRAAAVGSLGGSTGTLIAVRYRDICSTPCSFELDAGLRELVVHGDGVSAASRKLELQPGRQAFSVDPGSSALANIGLTLTIAGGVLLGIGVTLLAGGVDGPYTVPNVVGGAVGLGAGIPLWVMGTTSFESDSEEGPSEFAASKPLGLSLAGAF